MKCPVCVEPDLLMTDRQGIEVDYCPKCRGVWLDRGELDKLIDRSAPASAHPQTNDDYRYHKRKRKGLLGEIFDFD